MNPNGWSRKHLHEIASTFSGGTPSRRRPEYFNGTIPWIKSGEVNQRFIHHVEEFITQSALDDSSAKVVPPNSILVAMYGATAGKVGMSQFAAAINQAILAVRPNHHVANDYLFYFLEQALEKLAATHVQGGQPNLNAQIIRGVEVLLPPLAEQQRIVAILQTWEAAIKQLDHLIASKRERKRGLMQVLLTGKKRFKEFDRDPWRWMPLGSLGAVVSGGTPSTHTPSFWDGDVPWCTPSEVAALSSRFINTTSRTLSPSGLAKSSAVMLPAGSLIVCTRATIGACAINTVPMATNQGFKNVIPANGVDVEYLYYQMAFRKNQLLRLGSGSTFLEVSKKDFEAIEVPAPSITEQRKIASVLTAADAELENLEQQLQAYKLQKRGLMQHLLTGKKRVQIDELEAVA